MEFDNIETIKRAVEIDAGVALLPEPTVLHEVNAGTLVMVPLATDELVRPLGIIHRRGKELGSTTQRFIKLLQQHGQHLSSIVDDKAGADTQLVHNGHSSADGNGNAHLAAEQVSEPGPADRPRRAAYAKAT
jgi:hypothetical protein